MSYERLTDKQVNEWIQYAFDTVSSATGAILARNEITWEWSNRLTRAKGMAYRRSMKFSAKLFPLFPEDEQIDTVVHEACHIICNLMYKKRMGHGPEWKKLMVICGLEPERCYSFSSDAQRDAALSLRSAPKYFFKCGCKIHTMKRKTENVKRVMRGESVWTCRACGESLHYLKNHNADSLI